MQKVVEVFEEYGSSIFPPHELNRPGF